MEQKILYGKPVASSIEEDVSKRISKIMNDYKDFPILATIVAGNDEASKTYVNMKSKACNRVGIYNKIIELRSDATTEDVLAIIDRLNNDESISGILVQHPLPREIDEQKCFNMILPKKDIDGVNSKSFGDVTMKQDAFPSATPAAIMDILSYYDVPTEGRHAVVVGRSPILGKPVSMMLLNKDATVTICHTKTKNLPYILKSADIVVAACGSPEFIKKEWLKEGVVIVDAGYNKGNIGDVSKDAYSIASAYTPVPGGVGPVTIAEVLKHTTEAKERQLGYKESKILKKTINNQ